MTYPTSPGQQPGNLINKPASVTEQPRKNQGQLQLQFNFIAPNSNPVPYAQYYTRIVEAFSKGTAFAYLDPSQRAEFWWYAIAVLFKKKHFDITSTALQLQVCIPYHNLCIGETTHKSSSKIIQQMQVLHQYVLEYDTMQQTTCLSHELSTNPTDSTSNHPAKDTSYITWKTPKLQPPQAPTKSRNSCPKPKVHIRPSLLLLLIVIIPDKLLHPLLPRS